MTSPTWKTSDRGLVRDLVRLPVSSGRQGFTLLELLLAIGLMALMMGLTLPRIGAVKEAYFATEEARAVASSVRAARLGAISSRTTVALTVSLDSARLLEERRLPEQSWPSGDAAGLASIEQGWRGVWEAPVVRRTEVAGHVRLEALERGILFFANGSSTGGDIMIHDEDGRLQNHFRVESTTGELFVQQ